MLHASLISRLTFRPARSSCTRSNGPRTIFRLACYRFWNFWISESLSIREKCTEEKTNSSLIAIISIHPWNYGIPFSFVSYNIFTNPRTIYGLTIINDLQRKQIILISKIYYLTLGKRSVKLEKKNNN